ncbi:MAG: PAS domain-containing protein [Desulfatitalea sp.]|nr:PAS domain-containing protein [Desulfatitalea sp.]NNK02136.1 PAS domain-containing protein [Desulfatitalea sp.]
MLLFTWLLIALLFALLGWSLRRYREQTMRQIRLQKALREATVELHHIEQTRHKAETDRENAADRLRGYLQLLDTLINTIPNPIYFKDQDGVYQGCNKVFASQILGLTRDRIIGARPQSLPEQIPADLAAAYQHQEMIAAQKECHHAFEAPVLCADGTRREFLFSMAPFEPSGGGGVVAVLSDLTEKNRAAEVRLQKEKLEGVLETAGGVCHEFNQPLQALSGYMEILALKLAGNDPVLGYLNKASEQITRMGDITAKLQRITHYETMIYADKSRIIDLHKSARSATPDSAG